MNGFFLRPCGEHTYKQVINRCRGVMELEVVSQASCIFLVGKKEREKYIWTLWTAFHTRRRNVGGSNVTGPFGSGT